MASIGFMLVSMGALSLLTGRTHYQNYWGGPVFAPFAILAGLLYLADALTHWKKKL